MKQCILFLVQLLLLWSLAPLLEGVIKKIKARLQNRIGADLWQPYRDIFKYLRKDAVISQEASWLTRFTPYFCFVTLTSAGLLVPMFFVEAPLGLVGDIIVFVYLLALARFFLALTALDSGSAFGGMGSSREMVMAAITEPALLLAVVAVLFNLGTTSIENVTAVFAQRDWTLFSYEHWIACVAFFIIVIVETGRIPYDNPDTHLELTMLHEAMMLEYSGRYLGILHLSVMVKQMAMMTLLINFFLPWGIAMDFTVIGFAAGFAVYVVKLFLAAALLALTETLYAKIRLFMIPKLLLSSMGLSALAIILQIAK